MKALEKSDKVNDPGVLKLTDNTIFPQSKCSKYHSQLGQQLHQFSESELHEIIFNQSFEIDQLLEKLENREKQLTQTNHDNR